MKTSTYSKSNRLSLALAVCAFLLMPLAVHGQDAAPTRIGFVNAERLFSEAEASKAAQNKLKQEFSGRERQLLTQANTLKKAIDQFEQDAPKMPEDQRNAKQQQLMAQDADFQRKRQEFQEDLNNRKNDELQRFIQKANRVIEQTAKQEKYDVIIQEAAYINNRIDITDKVLRTLNAEK